MEEFKLLLKRINSVNFDKYWIELGIDDVSLFEYKDNVVNFVKFQIWEGMEEFKLF